MINNHTNSYPKQENYFLNSCPKNIFRVILGIVILLAGMFMSSYISEGITNTVVNIVPLFVAMAFVIKATKIEKICGNLLVGTGILMLVIVLFNLWLSSEYIFNNFISGYSTDLSDHAEHSLMYFEMSTIATRLKLGMTLQQATFGLPLYQYYNIFVYCSLMFLAGGINATNMCIWGAMHLFLCGIFVVLMLEKYGIKDKKRLRVAYFLSLLQPLFMSVNTYNKVLIGEAIILMAMYIYITNYNNPKRNLFALPIYGYLLWTVRLQYVAIAVFLFGVCLIHNRTSKKFIIPTFLGFVAVGVVLLAGVLGQSYTHLNFEYYLKGHEFSVASIPARFIRSFLPYFPITNLGKDPFWHFNLFAVFQEGMNIMLWGMIFTRRGKIIPKKFKSNFQNPFVLAALAFLLGGTLSELHTTYLSVGTMLLIGAIEDTNKYRFMMVYFAIMAVILSSSIMYGMLGFTGAGVAGVSFG